MSVLKVSAYWCGIDWLQSLIIIGELHKISYILRLDVHNHNQSQDQLFFLGYEVPENLCNSFGLPEVIKH